MANVRFRAPSIYVGGKKLGTINQTSYEVDSGDEPQFGDPGLLGYSDGAMQTKITADGVVPVAGMETDLVQAMKDKKDLDVALGIVNGKIHAVSMRCLKAQFTGKHQDGTLAGHFEFAGGEPNLTG